MKRLTSLLVSAVALQVPVAALATEHFEAVERALTDATLDLGAKGDSAGPADLVEPAVRRRQQDADRQ